MANSSSPETKKYKKRGLGRGLDTLLQPVPTNALVALPLSQLRIGRYQPRKKIDDHTLQSLAASIREHGVMQPIVVRRLTANSYEIVAGERRWRAAALAGLKNIPVTIRDDLSDKDTLAIALIENIQRTDLTPLEEAAALKRLADEFDLTHQEVGNIVGRSRVAVTNTMRLLHLGETAQRYLAEGSITMGHARAVLAITAVEQQDAVVELIVRQGWTVRHTEEHIQSLSRAKSKMKKRVSPKKRPVDSNVRVLQKELSQRLDAPVSIVAHTAHKGDIMVRYNSLQHLDNILARIKE